MSEFDEKLSAILGDADAMGRIMALAQSLSAPRSAQEETAEPVQEEEPRQSSVSGVEMGRDARLLAALRPYLRPERQGKVDRTLEMLSMIRMLRSLK